MAKAFRKLIESMPDKRRRRIDARTRRLLKDIDLCDLRRSRCITQEELARSLDIKQAAISKMEGQSDMHISTLRKLIEAMGGKLKIIAEFPEGEVFISQFAADND